MADTTIPIDFDTRDRLRGEKVGNETYSDVIDRLISDHDVVMRERDDPTGEYYACDDCGRNENTVQKLNERPCKEGISVKE